MRLFDALRIDQHCSLSGNDFALVKMCDDVYHYDVDYDIEQITIIVNMYARLYNEGNGGFRDETVAAIVAASSQVIDDVVSIILEELDEYSVLEHMATKYAQEVERFLFAEANKLIDKAI